MGCGSSTAVHHCQYSKVFEETTASQVVPNTSTSPEDSVNIFSSLDLQSLQLGLRDVYKLKQSWRAIQRGSPSTALDMMIR